LWSRKTPSGFSKTVWIWGGRGLPRSATRRWCPPGACLLCGEEQSAGADAFNLFINASTGQEVVDRWASLQMTDKRWPYQMDKVIQKQVNGSTARKMVQHSTIPVLVVRLPDDLN